MCIASSGSIGPAEETFTLSQSLYHGLHWWYDIVRTYSFCDHLWKIDLFSLDLFSSYKVVAVAVLWTLKRSAVFLKSWDGCSSTDIFSSRLRFLCFIGADSWNIEQIIYEWMNEWMNEWLNKWINEWMNEWRNK